MTDWRIETQALEALVQAHPEELQALRAEARRRQESLEARWRQKSPGDGTCQPCREFLDSQSAALADLLGHDGLGHRLRNVLGRHSIRSIERLREAADWELLDMPTLGPKGLRRIHLRLLAHDAAPRHAASQGPGASPHAPTSPPAPVAAGYVRVTETPFTLEIPDGWQRQDPSPAGKFVFTQGAYQVVVVAGRDPVGPYRGDPVAYRAVEPELADFRASEWSEAWGLDRARIGGRPGAQGIFAWEDSEGIRQYAENTVIIVGDRFHIVLVTGPDTKNGRDLVSRVARRASRTYTPTA